MLELIIERWSNRDGSVDFMWSLWQDGKRLTMGGRHGSADACEGEAMAFCETKLRHKPDRVTRL